MSSSLPQQRYFDTRYQLPSAPEWSLSGHSRALERTGFVLYGPATILLDAGIDVPESMGIADLILVTHTHIDHSNAIPMLLRHDRPGRLTHIFAPAQVVNRLREFAQLSFSMKVDYDSEVPAHYCTPPRVFTDDGEPVFESWEADKRRWRPVAAGLTVPVGVGKGQKQILVVQTVLLFHKQCSTVGYIVSERKSKLCPHLEGVDKKATAANVMQAKARGEQVTVDSDKPILAFICDTTIEAVTTGPHADLILSVPVVMIECTYLEASMEAEAWKRGHICWSQLCPIVIDKLQRLSEAPFSVILMHFSLRYNDSDIVSFFMNSDSNGLGEVFMRKTNGVVTIPPLDETKEAISKDCAETVSTSAAVDRTASVSAAPHYGPCHVSLWLDSGVEEIWFSAFI